MNQASSQQSNDFQLLFQNSNDAILLLDTGTLQATDCNLVTLQLFGYDALTEFAQETLGQLLDHSKLPQPFVYKNFILDIKTSITFKKKYAAELNFLTKSGELFLGEINITLVDNLEKSVFLCTIRDITEQRHTAKIQQFVFDLSMKKNLDDKEMINRVVEKALDMTASGFGIFVMLDQENDKYELVSHVFQKDYKKPLPNGLSVTKISEVDAAFSKMMTKNGPDRVNAVQTSNGEGSPWNRLIYVPIVIENKTKCFLAVFDKNTNYSLREMDFVAQMMQHFWLVLQSKLQSEATPQEKVNLEGMFDASRSAEKVLRQNQDRFQKLVSNMSEEVWVFNQAGEIIEANESACKHMGFSKVELLKLKFYEICPTVRKEEFQTLFDHIVTEGTLEFAGKFKRSNGTEYDFDMSANVVDFADEQMILCTARDVSEMKQSKEALQKSEKKYRSVLDQALEMIILCAIDGTIKEANEITCKSLGYSEKELQAFNIRTLMTNRTISYLNDAIDQEPAKKRFELTERVIRKDGSRLVGSIRGKIISFENEDYILITIRDVAEEMKQEEKIRFLNFHDKVSGLYNKAFFEDEIKRLDLGINLPLSIIMGDINGLKLVNSTYGHAFGDRLINTVAYIILGCCRAEDIVARWGGDEFVVLLPNADEKTCESICRTIEAVCKEYKERNGDLEDFIDPSISFGYSTKHREEEEINDVMKAAEDFMYKKKMLDKKSMHSSIVHSMKNTLFEKNFDNEAYSSRLNIICRKIGQALGLPDSELNELELLSILHDVGKIVIDAYVLNKDETLSESDWIEIRKHPEVGYRIIKSAPELASVAEYVLSHHERWDGKGYPNGIAGETIPLKSRIIAVADAYAAMTQDKSYRKAMQVEQAKTELTKNMNTQFDEHIVKIFLEILEKEETL